jgi:hypothetical protein
MSEVTSSAGRRGPRWMPASPWMPMPISIWSSGRVKVGLPAPGTVQGLRATPMERTCPRACSVTAATSSRDAPVSAQAPATL